MKNANKTEVMNWNVTEVMPSDKTEVMPSDRTEVMDLSRTAVMDFDEDINEEVHVITEENLTLLNGKYKIKRLLTDDSGEADIYLAEYDSEEFVIKLFRTRYKHDEAKNEIINSINSRYVINAVDSGQYKNRFFEVMPYYANGDLTNHKLDEEFVEKVVVNNMNEGLKAMHDKGIIHRDIKPNNIFLSNDKTHIIIGDFGISSKMGSNVTHKKTGNAKTSVYAAIETFRGIVTKAADYYSLGVTILEILTGKTSFEGCDEQEIFGKKTKGEIMIPKSVSPRFTTLIRGLTVMDRSNRWQYEEVKKWLNNEYVEVKNSTVDRNFERVYTFAGKKITNREELSLELANNWKDGKKNFVRGYLNDHFKTFDQELASKIEDCVEAVRKNNADYEFFKAIHLIYPSSPLIWKGEDLKSIPEFIKKLREKTMNENKDYIDFIFSGCLEHYLSVNGKSEEAVNALKEIRKISKEFPKRAYYAFLLLDNTEFVYRGQVFNSVEELVLYINNNLSNSTKISEELEHNDYFIMWIDRLGFAEARKEYLGY